MKFKKIFIVLLTTSGLFALIMLLLSLSVKKNTPTQPTMVAPTKSPLLFPTNIPFQTGNQNQEESDYNFAQELMRMRKQYPWYSSLPLISTNYFAYFDLDKKVVLAKIYSKSENLSEEQLKITKTEILSRLTSLGINFKDYPVVWQEGL